MPPQKESVAAMVTCKLLVRMQHERDLSAANGINEGAVRDTRTHTRVDTRPAFRGASSCLVRAQPVNAGLYTDQCVHVRFTRSHGLHAHPVMHRAYWHLTLHFHHENVR